MDIIRDMARDMRLGAHILLIGNQGTLLLGDGRRIQPASASVCERSIPLHPEFRIIMLANRPGFPFLGNDLFGVLGDLFSTHTVENPSRENELEMLKKYAPDVPDANLLKLMAAFTELREMADEGLLQYPYSTRELVNIVKHINKFPTDSLSTVIKNIFDFDTFSTEAFNTVREVFLKHGIPFG
uniref:Magnesium chelatase n=1 Tax=Angiostrongylus cantonensis TaxID=6313 RepID=A0A0K0DR63_ANGCA